ncbi:MAG TPA: hypothetical protein DCY40_05025 [Actinobacteria bacterium]|nr:hypothetical protein [Actinomycetota bacterium]
MGARWDHGVPSSLVWAEILRVLKPGAFLFAFGGTRTYHRLAVAVEDAGFEIRDSILAGAWIYGSGFPKALDVSKAIDKEAGAEREVVGPRVRVDGKAPGHAGGGYEGGFGPVDEVLVTAPSSLDAARFDGWKSALKPAWEPVVVGMKPLDGTFARNAVEHGVAGLNVDGGRIAGPAWSKEDGANGSGFNVTKFAGAIGDGESTRPYSARSGEGRYPSNLLLSHHPSCRRAGTRKVRANVCSGTAKAETSGYGGYGDRPLNGAHHGGEDGTEEVAAWECSPDCPVAAMDRQAGHLTSGGTPASRSADKFRNAYGAFKGGEVESGIGGSAGLSSRFFHQSDFEDDPLFGTYYCAKASTAERGGTRHPTIKPLKLVTYLASLLLPPARPDAPRRLLVPFSGAGSEVIGALRAGWEEVEGIEQEPEWIADAERRIVADAPLYDRVEVVSSGGADAG